MRCCLAKRFSPEPQEDGEGAFFPCCIAPGVFQQWFYGGHGVFAFRFLIMFYRGPGAEIAGQMVKGPFDIDGEDRRGDIRIGKWMVR